MYEEETAEVLSLSAATVERSWASARAWLYRQLMGMSLPLCQIFSIF
jgi:hypothetical protein